MSNFKGATHQKKHGKKQSTKFCAKFELVLPDKNEETELYVVDRAYGNGVFQVLKIDTNDSIKASITRSFKKGPTKEIISVGDTVLVQPGISTNQYFIIHRYSVSDIKELERLGIVTIKTKLALDQDQDQKDELNLDFEETIDEDENLFNNL